MLKILQEKKPTPSGGKRPLLQSLPYKLQELFLQAWSAMLNHAEFLHLLGYDPYGTETLCNLELMTMAVMQT